MSLGMIVLAEDDPKLRKLYTDFLEVSGFTVAAAKDGVEALGLLNGITPKVLILDIMMPNMDGIETCRRARKIIGSDVPIMFLTAAENLDKLQDCMQAGGDDYLIKREPLVEILARIKHWTRTAARQGMKTRRTNSLERIEVAVETHQKEWEDGADLSSKTDDRVRQMSKFVARARSLAPDGFGATVEQKLFLLGYVTGIVSHWAEIEAAVNSRFLCYLRAVLAETGLLSTGEIVQTIDAFDELSAEKVFETARARGQQDCVDAEGEGSGFVPKGLLEEPMSASA